MPKRLPDELFRKKSSQPEGIPAEKTEQSRPSMRPRPRHGAGVSGRLVAACSVAALLLGYVTVRVGILVGSPSETTSPAASNSATANLAPYDGAVVSVLPSFATGRCLDDGQDRAGSLADPEGESMWRCPGDGVGERITFTFAPGTELVGVRLVNGSNGEAEYAADRRVLAVRWTFADGSWLIQPMAADHPAEQEVRFPPVVTSVVDMEVLTSTDPGLEEPQHDAVALSRVEFLSRF